jgi:hypothetical protein
MRGDGGDEEQGERGDRCGGQAHAAEEGGGHQAGAGRAGGHAAGAGQADGHEAQPDARTAMPRERGVRASVKRGRGPPAAMKRRVTAVMHAATRSRPARCRRATARLIGRTAPILEPARGRPADLNPDNAAVRYEFCRVAGRGRAC